MNINVNDDEDTYVYNHSDQILSQFGSQISPNYKESDSHNSLIPENYIDGMDNMDQQDAAINPNEEDPQNSSSSIRYSSLNPIPPESENGFATLDSFNAQDSQNVTLSIPGGYKDNDVMEIDDSPQFTTELDLYFDSYTKGMDFESSQTLFPHNQYFIRQFKGSILASGDLPTNNVSPTSNVEKSGVNTPVPLTKLHFDTPNSGFNSQFQGQFDEASLYSSFINEPELESHLRNASIDSHFNPAFPSTHQGSFSNNPYANDLSPLTTTTSLTHSVNSIHSTQPSFFSAHQYLPRQSVELTNSHRNSVDFLSKSRNSLESSNSGQRPQRGNNNRYLSFTNSISNYIPFMGDKNHQRHSSLSQPSSPGSTHGSPGSAQGPPLGPSKVPAPAITQQPPRQPSKYLIRSIFKSNPQGMVQMEDERLDPSSDQSDFNNIPQTVNADFLMLSPTAEEPESDPLDPLPNNFNPKKIKKPKRSLFTRFKTPAKDLSEDLEDDSSKNSGGNSFIEEPELAFGGSLSGNISGVSSSSNTTKTNQNGDLENLNMEPDYAALFENVGKRKKIGKSNVKNKAKVKQEKVDPDVSADNSSFNNNDATSNSKVLLESATSLTSSSTALSDHSSERTKVKSNDDSSHVLAKRILGSKLMKRSTDKKQPELRNVKTKVIENGVEVEVDLKTLDLPENAEAFPISIVNSKNRTRGRKENKEADLTDLSKIFLCTYCSRRFKRQEHLKRHFRSLHTFEKPYNCNICHKKFSRSDNLNQHMKTHKEDGTYEAS